MTHKNIKNIASPNNTVITISAGKYVIKNLAIIWPIFITIVNSFVVFINQNYNANIGKVVTGMSLPPPPLPPPPLPPAERPQSKGILHLIRDFRTAVARERSTSNPTTKTTSSTGIEIKDQIRLNIRLKIQNSAELHISAVQQLGDELKKLVFPSDPVVFFNVIERFFDRVDKFFNVLPEELTELVRMKETGETESLWPIDRWSIATTLALFDRRRRSLQQEIETLAKLTGKTPESTWKELDVRTWYDGGAGSMSLITRVKAFITEATNMTIDVEHFLPEESPEEVVLFATADLVDKGLWLTKSGIRLSNTKVNGALSLLGVDKTGQQEIEKHMLRKATDLLTTLYTSYLEKASTLMKQEWQIFETLVASNSPRQGDQLIRVANEMIQFAAKRVLSEKALEKKFVTSPSAGDIEALMKLMLEQFELRKGELNLKAIQISSNYLPVDVKFCDGCNQNLVESALICGTCSVAFYCSTECAMSSEEQHLIECRGHGAGTVDNLFKHPVFDTAASISQSLTLENGQKYFELVITSEKQRGQEETRYGQRCIPLFSIPASALPAEVPSINFLSIDINPYQIGPNVSADADMDYTLYRQADFLQSIQTVSNSLDGPIVINYVDGLNKEPPLMEPSPDKLIVLSAGESILLGIDDGIEEYVITVQVGLQEQEGHLW